MINGIFLDASFWIAYRNERDPLHPMARRLLGQLFSQKILLVTTLPVICEIHAYFVRLRLKRELILKDLCDNRIVVIEEISHEDRANALALLRSHEDKTYSLCDGLSFVVMQRLRLKRALAFDDHFRQFGEFEVLPNKFS